MGACFPGAAHVTRHRVLIVEDHPIVGAGLTALINATSDLCVCGLVETAEHALEAIATMQPDLAVVDLRLKGYGGLDFIRDLKRQGPGLPILVLSMYDETLYAERVMRAGAQGYIMKEAAMDELMAAIRRVLDGGVYLSERVGATILKNLARGTGTPTGLGRLTNRELDVLHLLGQGYNTRQTATLLCVSVKTVEAHRSNLMKKLHLRHATDLVRYAAHWVANPDSC